MRVVIERAVRRRYFSLIVLLALSAAFIMQASWALAMETIARQAFMMDFDTGVVLFEKNAREPMPTASMSKMMTAHLVFDRLKKGKLKLDDTFVVSENAWRIGGAKSGGSTMFLEPGERVTVEDLLRGVIIQSGNDASIVLAEGISGSEEAFAEELTGMAKDIGLSDSTFRNASGLPDPEHHMTARDLAYLAKHTIEAFPEYYPYYAEIEFMHNGIKQGNRNPLLYRSIGADGLKTGHTEASGFGLTASAVRGDRRLILVLNGLPSMNSRGEEAERLLDYGFRSFENRRLFKAGEEVGRAEVWYGEAGYVPLVSASDIIVTVPRAATSDVSASVVYSGPIPAPIQKGAALGALQIKSETSGELDVIERPLVAGADVGRLGIFGRAVFTAEQLFKSLMD